MPILNQPEVHSLLENLIGELVTEITARTGPRTGGYAFDPEVIQAIASQAYDFRKKTENGMNSSSPAIKREALKTKVVPYIIKNPITGKNQKIMFHFYYDKDDTATGWYTPYKGAVKGGKVSLNTSEADPTLPWFKSVISHELSHYFDKERQISLGSDASTDAYYESPNEQMAFGQQAIFEMTNIARGIVEDIKKGKDLSVSFAKGLIQKPHVLLANFMSRDPKFKNFVTAISYKNPDWLKKLYRSCFDITRNILQPAVTEYEQNKKNGVPKAKPNF